MDVQCRVKFGSFELELRVDGMTPMYIAAVGKLVCDIFEVIPFC